MNNKLFIIFFILKVGLITGQVSPFNRLSIADTSDNYNFIVSGHFHGASTNISSFPASSLLANIDTLNSLHSAFLMSLGDLFLDVNDQYVSHYQKSLFNKLHMPLMNAVGNHDLAGGSYEQRFGKTFYYYFIRSELYVVLNTEMDDGKIKGAQLEMLKDALNQSVEKGVRNVFIFSHRPVWAEELERYKSLFKDNTRSSFSNNFTSEVQPLLLNISGKINLYWISGSMGGMAPSSFFYDKDPKTNITFIQTAIRDLPRDAALLVNLNKGKVNFSGISFTGEKLLPVENYSLDFWQSNLPPEVHFNFRMLPYLTIQMLKHYYFWTGALTMLLFYFSLRLFIRWKRKK
jgi:hypothetical protein